MYVGYFENPSGEQWVFIGDARTGKAVIRGGDCGWEKEFKVSLRSPSPDTVLNEPEKMWVISCFMAMSRKPFDEIVINFNKAAERLVAAARKQMEKPHEGP